MSVRLWYPQLDVYDAVRRMAALLVSWKGRPASKERLYIVDFFFANPPLLHRTHMPDEVRKAFNGLKIERPEKSFLSYPSGPILFQKMAEVQRQALQTLVGKGLLDLESLASGEVIPSESGRSLFSDRMIRLVSETEWPLLGFLSDKFASIGDEDILTLRRSTGLRRLSQ
ncbi:MAG TPA: ABC-three component system middle component 5 [Rhizomicrobium sp.]|nr:ABC-three component system middle component 5 [Rhizomicrobium sp.]